MILNASDLGCVTECAGDMPVHRFSHEAMATTFEIFCVHADAAYARQAAWAAFDLVDRLEQDLSRFIENSDISRINNLTAGENIRVSSWTMECLMLSRLAYAETGGAFDISLGSGLHRLELAHDPLLVRAGANGIRLDLGGIGKGYALDRMAEVLIDWEVPQALLHGGFSSVLALDAPPGNRGWPLTLSPPSNGPAAAFATVQASRIVFSASGVKKGQHIRNVNVRQGGQIRAAAWAVAGVDALAPFCRKAQPAGEGARSMRPSPAAVAELFSTAFMMLDLRQVENCCDRWRGLEAWLIDHGVNDVQGRRPVLHVPKGNSLYEVYETTPRVDGGCTLP
jgi:thiamine biosynthesis lipoprotein